MKKQYSVTYLLVLGLTLGWPWVAVAQQLAVVVDLSSIDGMELTPKNVFNYRIINNGADVRDLTVTGTIKFRNSRLQAFYKFDTRIYPGNNQFSAETITNPNWVFSENAFKELFFDYGKLPQGTYEYCVSIALKKIVTENPVSEPVNDCIYQTVNDIFLINLVEPEDNAELHEYYPMLSWVVNYPFASALTYCVRVVELKKGQNNENAITRNNPIYVDNNVSPTSLVYPVTAKPLQVFQPYVWTVDAYYKGILLGGAEAWRFTIVEDSVLQPKEVVQSYYDFEHHIGETRISAPGTLKLKYRSDKMSDTMYLKVFSNKGKAVKLPNDKIPVRNGDNMIDILFFEKVNLKHNGDYILQIDIKGKAFQIPFVYTNPLFMK